LYCRPLTNHYKWSIAIVILYIDLQLTTFDALYENNFKLAKILIDSGKLEVNIKDDYGDTPLIVVCQWTTIQNEDEAGASNNLAIYSSILALFRVAFFLRHFRIFARRYSIL
jgi:hypothetical protein